MVVAVADGTEIKYFESASCSGLSCLPADMPGGGLAYISDDTIWGVVRPNFTALKTRQAIMFPMSTFGTVNIVWRTGATEGVRISVTVTMLTPTVILSECNITFRVESGAVGAHM